MFAKKFRVLDGSKGGESADRNSFAGLPMNTFQFGQVPNVQKVFGFE